MTGMTAPVPTLDRSGQADRRRRRLRGLVTVGLVAVALFLLVWGLASKREELPPVRRAGLVRWSPAEGSVAVRQGAIDVELGFGYDGELSINNRPIPDDQVDRIAGINRLSFTPGPGKEYESLPEGRNCVSITFWTTAAGRESASRPFSWCFTAA